MAEKTGYEIAVERIEEVARTGATKLDLSMLGLTKIPEELIYDTQILRGLVKNEEPVTLVSPSRRLRVTLIHAPVDKQKARELYEQLRTESWMDVWFDEDQLLAGTDFELEERDAIRQSDVVILCLSNYLMSHDDSIHGGIRGIREVFVTMPDRSGFVIPLRLDDCKTFDWLRNIQYGDYFPEENQKWNYQRVLESLKIRAWKLSVLNPIPQPSSKSLSVFLCHVKEDHQAAQDIYHQLVAEGWMDIWLDDFNVLPGMLWEQEIQIAIQQADTVIVCLSTYSLTKVSYYSEEVRLILDTQLEKPEGSFYVIPLRLDECQMPLPFNKFQWIDYISKNKRQSNYYNKLLGAMKARVLQIAPEILEKPKRNLNLSSLDLSFNQLNYLPPEFGQLASLIDLNLKSNQFEKLPLEISQLTSLKYLNFGSNRLTDLPPEIGYLKNLLSFELSSNQFVNPPLALKGLTGLEQLDIRDNPLSIPPEILDKVSEPQVIFNYLVGIWAGQRKPLAETKMLVVGQGSVGKTSIIRRLIDNHFKSYETKTDGIAINRWQVINSEIGENQPEFLRVNIWDFGGQEIMHATHQFFLTRRSLYVLVVDSRISQEENRVEYWLKIIESFGGESPVLIVGNKTDQHPLDIDRTGLQKKYPNIVGILETSAAREIGLEELKSAIAEQVNALPHVRDSIPIAWFNIKGQLEKLGHEQNYISQERYEEKCTELEVKDELSQRTLIGFLHDLGIVLHFQDDPRLESLGILNPQWVTNGVYKILNAHALFQNKGVLERSMLADILPEEDYPANKRLFIVDMMRKFELCYDIVPEQTFLVPDLLPKDEPFTGEWDGALAFQYHYNVLPSSIITRFIVRMNAYIHKTVWRAGVVLQKDGNTALVKADTEDKKIYIWVNGAEHTRRDFLSVIRAEFDAIHKTIIKIEATEKVPVPGHPETEPIPFAMLLQAEREGRSTIPVMADGKLIDVNVRELLNGVRVGDAPVPVVERAAPITPVPVVETKPEPVSVPAPQLSMPLKILRWVFVEFPKIVGRIPLDIVGKGKDAADSTLISLGYGIIALILLVVFGYIGLDALITMAKDIWRFFFPVKP